MNRPKKHKLNRQKKHNVRDHKSEAIRVAAKVPFAAILGVLLIFLFGTSASALVEHYRVSACNNLYEDRELEILSYRDGPNSSSDDPKRIRGVLHPDGTEVFTDDNSVSLMSLNGSDSLIQMAPSEASVIGKRIKVKYYVGKVEDRRWWHPHSIHNHIQFTDRSLIRMWAMTIVYLGAILTCFVYGYRMNRKFAHLEQHAGRDES
jgi:hypothetical protein